MRSQVAELSCLPKTSSIDFSDLLALTDMPKCRKIRCRWSQMKVNVTIYQGNASASCCRARITSSHDSLMRGTGVITCQWGLLLRRSLQMSEYKFLNRSCGISFREVGLRWIGVYGLRRQKLDLLAPFVHFRIRIYYLTTVKSVRPIPRPSQRGLCLVRPWTRIH
jgi:hypothetical protein